MHYILIIGMLNAVNPPIERFPSLARCEESRQGYIQAGIKVSECIDKTLIKPKQPSKAFIDGFKEEMAKPEQPEGQDI